MRASLHVIVLTTCYLNACSSGDTNPQGAAPGQSTAVDAAPSTNATLSATENGSDPVGTGAPATSPTEDLPQSPSAASPAAPSSSAGEDTGAAGSGGTGADDAGGPAASGSHSGPDDGAGATVNVDPGAAGDTGLGGASSDPGDDSGGTPGTAGAGGAIGSTVEPELCVVDHGDEVPSLRDYYSDHFAIGAAIDTEYDAYAGLLTKHFNSVTAEDQMKFDALQPSENNFTYGTADQMVDFAVQNGMQVRGHALVWHRQTPAWVFSGSSQQVLQRMRNHISQVMQHFQGKVQVWDVVNEAVMDDGTYRTGNEEGADQSSGWYGALGESYIAEAFIAARAADPSAKLFYNDYYNYHPARRQAIYEMLAGLLEAGVPIDGVGLQCHINLAPGTDPNEQSYHQTVENLEQAIEMYASLGLDVQVTEMDLSVYLRGIQYTPDMFYTPETFTPEVQQQQAERYREFFELFRKHSDKISSVSLWGIADDNTWLSEFSSGRQDFPLLFDAQQQPKPAFWTVVDFCR